MKKREAIHRAPTSAPAVVIQQPSVAEVVLEISGTADLIQNNFAQKSVEQMLRKHMGISVQREVKVPRQVIEDAKILNMDGRVCLPPTAIKKAMITASASVKGLKKTQLRTQLFVYGASIPILYKAVVPRMDIVRTSGMSRTPDVRFRPMFTEWSARVAIQYGDTLAVSTVVDLLNRAGKVGVGEWRPEKDGTFGTFRVSRYISSPREIEDVHEECAVALKPLVIPEWALDMEIDPAVLQRVFRGALDEAGMATEDETQDDTDETKGD